MSEPDLSKPAPPVAPRSALPDPAQLGLSRRVLWIALAVVVAIYVVYSTFGIAGPFLWGHYGYHGSSYALRARMTMRFGLIVPATSGGWDAPPGMEAYYLHHPIGYHHLLVPFFWLFGDAEWVVRLVAMLGGMVTLWALWRLVRRFWSDTTALVAVLIYATLPIVCSFSILADPMFLEMACVLLATEAFLGLQQDPEDKNGDLLRGCLALFFGGLLMWEVYFQAFFFGLVAMGLWVRDRLFRRGPSTRGRHLLSAPARWFWGSFFATVVPFVFHFVFTWRVGMWADFTSSFHERSNASWGWVYSQLSKWLHILYGRPLLGIGALWLAWFLVRLVTGRSRRRDGAILLFFGLNSLYYVLFARGAAIHLYRVFFFSSFLALSTVDLLSDLYAAVAAWAGRRVAQGQIGAARWGLLLCGVPLSLLLIVQAPHVLHNLRESREMMGTHGHIGYDADYAKQRFSQEMGRTLSRDDYFLTYNFVRRIEFHYYIDRRETVLSSWSQLEPQRKLHPQSVLLTDVRMGPYDQRVLYDLLRTHSATLYHPYLMVDLRQPKAGVGAAPGADLPNFQEFRFASGRPSWVWRWFYSHKYPPLSPVPQLSTFGQCVVAAQRATSGPRPVDAAQAAAVVVPKVTAATPLSALVCYHNYLVSVGRDSDAAQFRMGLQTLLQPPAGPDGGVLGYRVIRDGQNQRAEVWLLRGSDPAPAGTRFRVDSADASGTFDGAGAEPPLEGDLFSAAGPHPWLWAQGRGYLVVDAVPLRKGKQRIRLQGARPIDVGVVEVK